MDVVHTLLAIVVHNSWSTLQMEEGKKKEKKTEDKKKAPYYVAIFMR